MEKVIENKAEELKSQLDNTRKELDHFSKNLRKMAIGGGAELLKYFLKEKKFLRKKIDEAKDNLHEYLKRMDNMNFDSENLKKETKHFKENLKDNMGKKSKKLKKGSRRTKVTFEKLILAAILIAANKERIKNLLEKAYKKFQDTDKKKWLDDSGEKMVLFFQMLYAYYKGYYTDVSQETILKLIAGVLYFVVLFDVIPDFLPIIGLVDDLAVLLWIFDSIDSDIEKFRAWKSEDLRSENNLGI